MTSNKYMSMGLNRIPKDLAPKCMECNEPMRPIFDRRHQKKKGGSACFAFKNYVGCQPCNRIVGFKF